VDDSNYDTATDVEWRWLGGSGLTSGSGWVAVGSSAWVWQCGQAPFFHPFLLIFTHFSSIFTHFSLIFAHFSSIFTHFSSIFTHFHSILTHFHSISTHFHSISPNFDPQNQLLCLDGLAIVARFDSCGVLTESAAIIRKPICGSMEEGTELVSEIFRGF
jgi:hypothetical protein